MTNKKGLSNEYDQDELQHIMNLHNGELGVTWEDPDAVTPGTIAKVQAHYEQLMLEVIGEDVELDAKYEDIQPDGGMITTIDDEDEEMTGERIAHLANYVADKTGNELRAEQRQNLLKALEGDDE